MLYTVTYAVIGGDAPNGHRDLIATDSGVEAHHYVRGHFIRSRDGKEREVSAAVWTYSFLHSITLPLTSGAMIVSMLVLARPHIMATMRDGLIRGPAFITAFSILVLTISVLVAAMFTWDFAIELGRS